MLVLFTLLTRIRAWVVTDPETVQLCEPSLAVLLKSVVHEVPPLREIWICTLPLTPLEFHWIVLVLPVGQVSPPLGVTTVIEVVVVVADNLDVVSKIVSEPFDRQPRAFRLGTERLTQESDKPLTFSQGFLAVVGRSKLGAGLLTGCGADIDVILHGFLLSRRGG